MKSLLSTAAHAAFQALGLSAVRSSQTYEANRLTIFRKAGIDMAIDVGANRGQYANALRRGGFAGWICSFEPLPDAFLELCRSRRGDAYWRGRNIALGASEGSAPFHVSSDSVCSSMRAPTSALLSAIPTAATTGDIEVEVGTLDHETLPPFSRAALKLDVQGFEREVLAGATTLLPRVEVLEIELAVVPTYEGSYTLSEAVPEIEAMGFGLMSIGRGASDTASGRLLDADLLFQRVSGAERA